MPIKTAKPFILISTLALPIVVGCDLAKPATGSSIDVTEIPQTSVKRQSINNCWAYAVAGWVEAMHLKATGQHIDVSESYLSYWASYDDLLDNPESTELNEGGTWSIARGIFLKYGYVLEEAFAPEEAGKDMSARQEAAIKAINAQLKPGGRLHGKETRTKENITKELDLAFGVDIAALRKGAQKAETLMVANPSGPSINLKDALQGDAKWAPVKNPQKYGVDEVPSSVATKRKDLVVRMQRALNDGFPLVISFKVGFDALDPADGTFKLARAKERGLGQQAGHMVIIDDYVVDDVPGIGTIGEGNVSPEQKEAALKGTVRYFKVKNSWGTSRDDRGLTDGYTKINLDYLMANLPWEADDGAVAISSSAFLDVALPPGY